VKNGRCEDGSCSSFEEHDVGGWDGGGRDATRR
jgi:hypothetical protein